MKPPTKFQLMRENRADAEKRAGIHDVNAVIEEQRRYMARAIETTAPPPAPAVPTMEIDGVRYCESTRTAFGKDECQGCAFVDDRAACCDADRYAVSAFGGLCYEREVIYIRAGCARARLREAVNWWARQPPYLRFKPLNVLTVAAPATADTNTRYNT